jgi:predicted secreted protein with PEFG-CTERM motif
MTHEYCGEEALRLNKVIFQGMGEDLTKYSSEDYDKAMRLAGNHEEALKLIKESLQGRIDSYNEAKHYIEEVCHQSTAGIDKASDLAHEVINVPEFGAIALMIMGVATCMGVILFRSRFSSFFKTF